MNNLHYEELQQKFDGELTSLARVDVDLLNCESQLIKYERYSLSWYHEFEKLAALNKKRTMVASRLATLRIELEKGKRAAVNKFRFKVDCRARAGGC